MKGLLVLIYLSVFFLGYAQQPDKLEEIYTSERLFQGIIHEKYAITMYLEYAQSSGEHEGIYSVEGWYYYNTVQKKIPVFGLYDNGDLTLFTSKNKAMKDSILHFNYDAMNIWSGLEILKSKKGYDERFEIGPGTANQWTNKEKTLSVQLFANNLSIEQHETFLITSFENKQKVIALDEMLPTVSDLTLQHALHNSKQHSFLFSYDFVSNGYVQGRCGAGFEKGYIVLLYDEHYHFITSNQLELESCYGGIYFEELPESSQQLKKFSVTKDGEETHVATVDFATNTFTIK